MSKNDALPPWRILHTLLLAAGLSLLTAAPAAFAVGEKDGWYIGGSYGNYKIDNDNDLDAAFADFGYTTVTSPKKSNDFYRLFAGYQFAKWFALEVAYASMGTLTFSGTDSTGATYSGTYQPEGALVDVMLALPIYTDVNKRVSLFLRGGAFRWDSERRLTGTSGLVGPASGREHDVDAHAAIGVHIRGLRHAAIRIGYERFKNVQGVDLNVAALDLMYYY